MVLIDEQDWPLVLVRWDTPIGSMDTEFCAGSLAAWIKRAPRFAVLSIQPSELSGARLQKSFGSAPRPGTRCAGIALTWTDGRRDPAAGADDAEHLGTQLGCPVQAFLDTDAALRWLRAQLATPATIASPLRVRAMRESASPPG
ncbi:MAG TPA: hypothetical protein VGE51_08935 [Fontimonas sp.]